MNTLIQAFSAPSPEAVELSRHWHELAIQIAPRIHVKEEQPAYWAKFQRERMPKPHSNEVATAPTNPLIEG